MFFNATISVTIANKLLKTVIEVETNNDNKHIGSECTVLVPINCRIQYKDGKHDYLTAYPKVLFKAGDPILITAQYDGYAPVKVFEGFVFNFIEGDEMKIHCTDDIYLLYQTTVNVHYKNITIKDLVTSILKGTGLTLQLPTIDLQLKDITFRLMSPAAILEWLKKELGINISLDGKQIYMNVASNTLNTVKLNTARNVIKSDLQTPEAVFQTFKIKAWFIQQNGTKDSFELGDTNGQLHEVFFYKIPKDLKVYQKLAAEALLKVKQQRYAGKIETLLYPEINLFDRVQYTDVRYPDRSGDYVVTGMNFKIGRNGFNRESMLAYLSDLNTTS
jgi:hypothetical protein